MADGKGRSPGADIPRRDAAAVRARNDKAKLKPRPKARGTIDASSVAGSRSRPAPDRPEPPRGDTHPAPITPPSLARERLLPLVDVGSRKFEELCQAVLKSAFPRLVRTELKREPGVRQYGVDVEGFDVDGYPTVVVSSKCYRGVNASDFRPWIDDFLKHVDGHWAGKRVADFVLAVTAECNDDDMNDAARALIAEMKVRGVRFHLWGAVQLTDLLAQDASTVARFFNDVWAEAIVARRPDAPDLLGPNSGLSPTPGEAVAFDALRQIAESLASPAWAQVDHLAAQRLEEALRRCREGRPSVLRAWLRAARDDDVTWRRLDPTTRSRALRAAAALDAQDGDLAAAREAIAEADRLAEAPDAASHALLAYYAGDPVRALAMLDARTARERELGAALLVEAGRAPEALTSLRSIEGSAVTPEVLRLRAVATFLSGDRDRALRLAESASARAAGEAAAAMTLAMLRFNFALVDGVRPRLAGAPDPISAGLFAGTSRSRDLLDLAIAGFDRLRLSVEGSMRRDCEIWRLAGLLLHPDRHEEAATCVRSMLSLALPDPLAVCWALTFGLVRRRGRIRKAFGDAVRVGAATPSHLVALALMSASVERPGRGAVVIARYAGRFPHAVKFLAGWRAQLGEGTAAPTGVYVAALRGFLSTGDAGALLELLSEADVEDLLSGAETLAARFAWGALDTLRTRMRALGTPRALELAAMAALNAGDAEGCLAVVAQAVAGGMPPRRLVHLRIKANEALGRHRPVIVDLTALAGDGGDDYVDRKLMDVYARIGALSDFETVARRALGRGGLEPRAALQVADVLRAASPRFARLALEAAVRGDVEPDLVGPTLSLASDLGAASVQRDMLRILTSQGPSPGTRSFGSPEEVVAFLDERMRDYRARLDDWLAGRVPAAVAMAGDLRTFGRLFLAEPDQRHDETGMAFAMLLRSGAPRTAAALPPHKSDAPPTPLRIDLGALLLADRLDLLPRLERLFDLRVPPSAPEALRELEAAFPPVDPALLDVLDRALSPHADVLRLVADVPAEVRPVEDAARPGELSPAIVAGLLDAAFRDGHLDRAGRNQARAALLEGDVVAEPVMEASLSTIALVRLAATGVLESLARTAALYVGAEDAERCRRDVRRWRHDRVVLERVSALRTVTADRLALGRWTTVPVAPTAADGSAPRPPAHVRCLLEAVAGSGPGAAFWIEDRFVSHARLEGAHDVLGILDRLRSAGLLDASGADEALRRLEDAGYAYLPVEDGFLLAALRAARVEGGRVVEGPELVRERRRHARDARLLAHVDARVALAEDGRVASEARRLVDVCGRARTMLRSVWSDADATDPERRARADWLWTFLGPLEATRPGTDLAEARLFYAAAVLAHVVDLALLAELGDGEVGDGTRRAFVDWFAQVGLEPFAAGDECASEALADALASIILGLLRDEEAAAPDDAEQVRAFFEALARRFLGLLPDRWRDLVLDRHDLRARLGMAMVTVFGVGDGPRVTAGALADAIARAATGATTPLELVGGAEGSLRLDDAAAPVPRPIVIVDGAEASFEAAICVLLDPDVERRERMLPMLEGLAPPQSDLPPEALEAVARIADAGARITGFETLVGGDLRRRFALAEERLRTSGRLLPEDLEPPAVASVMTYLASGADASGAPRLADGVCDRVRARSPIAEAARRLAGLPYDPTAGLLAELGGWLAEPEGEGLAAESPLLAFLALRALLHVHAQPAQTERAFARLVDSLRERGRLFAGLVRLATIRSLDRGDWLRLDPETHVALVWTFADRLAQIVAEPGVDLDEIAAVLMRRAVTTVAQDDAVAYRPEWWRRLTADLEEDVLAGAIAAVLGGDGGAGRLPETATAALADLVGVPGPDGTRHPRLPLLRVAPPAPSRMWAARDAVGALLRAGLFDPRAWFSDRDDAAIAARIVDGMGAGEQSLFVPVMLSFVRLSRIPREALGRLVPLIDEIEAEARFEPDRGAVQRALAARAAAAAGLGEIDVMHAALSRQARRCAARWPAQAVPTEGRSSEAMALSILLEAAYEHSRLLQLPRPRRLAVYARGVGAILDAWPAAAHAALVQLVAVSRQGGVESAAEIRPILSDLAMRF